jgi:hypothetical protein
MTLPSDFWVSFLGPTAGAVAVVVVSSLWSKLAHRLNRSSQTTADLIFLKTEINENFDTLKGSIKTVNDKVDTFSKSYHEGAVKNHRSQVTMFEVQDLQFSVMSRLTGAIREIGRSVCNGNKNKALSLCDDADEQVEKGKSLQRDYLLDK